MMMVMQQLTDYCLVGFSLFLFCSIYFLSDKDAECH